MKIQVKFFRWVGDSLGKRRHRRGQEETFEPPYLEEKKALAWVCCLGKVVAIS